MVPVVKAIIKNMRIYSGCLRPNLEKNSPLWPDYARMTQPDGVTDRGNGFSGPELWRAQLQR